MKNQGNLLTRVFKSGSPTVHNLEITVQYGGELTNIRGTVSVKGKSYHVSCEISADERMAIATIDDQEFWWCGSEQNSVNPAIERELERVLEDAYQLARRKRINFNFDWGASITSTIRVKQLSYEGVPANS